MVRGLETAPPGRPAHVYTPSDYAAQGAEKWARNWAVHGWRTKDGQPVKHHDLWQAVLAQAAARPVRWHCLKGAAHPAESQQAEALARQAARSGPGA
jgi:ribonuclease HI